MAVPGSTRALVWAVGFAIAAASVGRVYLLQGLWQPVRIAGGSMAETLLGDHYRLTCAECGFPIRHDADAPPRDGRVVCPNCGGVNSHEDGEFHRGQRVLIDRAAYLANSPQRWDAVAFPEPDVSDRLAVKRVIGLPGEQVSIRHGDIYINGRLQQKTLGQLRSLAVLVHDDAFRPSLPDRWQAWQDITDWRRRGSGLECRGGVEGDYLTYHHWRCFDSPRPRTELSPVLDNCGYNQGESRQLQLAPDLLLTCRLTVTGGNGIVVFAIHDGFERYEVELFPRRQRGNLRGRRMTEVRFRLPDCPFARGVRIELASCDRRILFAIDGRVLLEYDCGPWPPGAERGPSSKSHPHSLFLRTRKLSATIHGLQVWRDLYYLDPLGVGRDWSAPRPLADDEYFVVGDNPAISQDSRHWPSFAIPRRIILGKVR